CNSDAAAATGSNFAHDLPYELLRSDYVCTVLVRPVDSSVYNSEVRRGRVNGRYKYELPDVNALVGQGDELLVLRTIVPSERAGRSEKRYGEIENALLRSEV